MSTKKKKWWWLESNWFVNDSWYDSLLARPVFDPRYGILWSLLYRLITVLTLWLNLATVHMGMNSDPTKLMEDYSRNCKYIFFHDYMHSILIDYIIWIASYLINLSQAVGRLILTGRDLTRFAGYTVSTTTTPCFYYGSTNLEPYLVACGWFVWCIIWCSQWQI